MSFRGTGALLEGSDFGPPTGQVAVGAGESEGLSPYATRADHVHAFPAAVGGAGASASRPGDAEADGVATTAPRSDHKHSREAWGVLAQITGSTPGTAGAAGASGAVADAAHAHAREAWGTAGDIGTGAFGTPAGAGASGTVADAGHTHATPAGIGVEAAGTLESTRPTINLVAGAGITVAVADNAGAARADVTISGAGALVQLGSFVLGGSAFSLTFSSIPQTSNHLRLVAVGRGLHTTAVDNWSVQLNGVSAADYDTQSVYGAAALAESGTNAAATSWLGAHTDLPTAFSTAGVAGQLDLEIPFYAGTTFDKTGRWQSGFYDGVAGTSCALSAQCGFRSTAAVTSITINTVSGSGFAAPSGAYLYGFN